MKTVTMRWCVSVWLAVLLLHLATAQDVFVETSKGRLRGYVNLSSRDQTPFAAFVGIPYAQPPVGELRFKEPLEHPGWNGTRDALEEGQICYSFSQNGGQSEDCLFLNVFVPNYDNRSNESKAVMVFIHGGAFYAGSGDIHSNCPDFYMDHDVIFVSINYRLGPMGYLSLQIPEAPGNAGSKDQVLALKWIKQNIEAFGGDPNRITIFGESAGGASVSFLQLSPLVKGLISGTIHQSGEATVPWSYITPEQAISRAFRLGQAIGCHIFDTSEAGRRAMYECLLEAAPSDISYNQGTITTGEDYRRCTYYQFVPTAEPDLPGAFITKPPVEILESGSFEKVPSILGANLREGLLYLGDYITLDPSATLFGQNLTNFIPLDLIPSLNPSTENMIDNRIRQYYFHNQLINQLNRDYFLDTRTDTGFVIDMMRQTLLMAQNSSAPVYNYFFVYDSPFGYNYGWGPGHGDELPFLMDPVALRDKFDQYPRNSTPHLVVDRMTTMWTNFAKYGNPTPELNDVITTQWQPFTTEEHNYLEIGDDLAVKQGLAGERMKFWNDIYDEIQQRRPLPE